MLNLNDEKSTPRVVQTGVCWFCNQTRPLTETMYVPFNFLTDKITRRSADGQILGYWKEDETRVPRDFLMEKNSFQLIYRRNRSNHEIETKWKYTIVSVPRCAECFQAHQRFLKTYKVIKLLLIAAFAVGIGLMTWNAYNVSGATAAFFLLAISSFIFFLVLKILGRYINILINYAADSLGYNTERRSRTFPASVELLRQGWKLGENPDVTPESYSI
jgi:hypothetical protein